MRLSPLDPGTFSFCQALALAHLAAGRYEAALPWAEEALRENGGMPALRLKLSLCGHLGRHDEASEYLRRLREIHSEPTIAGVIARFAKGFPRDRRPPRRRATQSRIAGAMTPKVSGVMPIRLNVDTWRASSPSWSGSTGP